MLKFLELKIIKKYFQDNSSSLIAIKFKNTVIFFKLKPFVYYSSLYIFYRTYQKLHAKKVDLLYKNVLRT